MPDSQEPSKIDKDMISALMNGRHIMLEKQDNGGYIAILGEGDNAIHGCTAPLPSVALFGLLKKAATLP